MSSKKRITYGINSHGKELIGQGLQLEGIEVLVFSTTGELGVCSLAQDYEDGTSFNQAAVDVLKQRFTALLEKEHGSTFQVLKHFLSEYEEAYQDFMSNFIDELMKEDQSDARLDARLRERDLEEARKAQQSKPRMYQPIFDKEYTFYSHAFVDVIHHDSVDSSDDFTEMELPDIIQHVLEPADARVMLAEITDRGYITLSQLIQISIAAGFDVVNVLDFSCRDTTDVVPEDAVETVVEERSYGGGGGKHGGKKKKSKKRKPKNDKRKSKKSQKNFFM